jgi:hypothetical protein
MTFKTTQDFLTKKHSKYIGRVGCAHLFPANGGHSPPYDDSGRSAWTRFRADPFVAAFKIPGQFRQHQLFRQSFEIGDAF